MKNIIALLALCTLTSTFANYEDNVEGSDNSSGCGYGWEVTKGKTLSASSTRSTTNATASNTIAMTMGTSGCEKHDIVMNEKEQLHFANSNYDILVAEMSQGQGEYLNSFATMLGCDSSSFGQSAQENLESLMAQSGRDLLTNIKNSSAMSAACL